MATKAQIRQRVGEELALVAIGQTLQSQHQTRIDAAYDEVYERLKKQGLAVWASTASVPTQLVPYVALMVEEKLLHAYSVPEQRFTRIKYDAGDDGKKAMLAIAGLVAGDYTSTDEPQDF